MPNSLSREKALLISCQGLDLFFAQTLLVLSNGVVRPASNVESLRIADVMVNVYENDERFGTVAVKSTVSYMRRRCREEGFKVSLSVADFATGTFATMNDLAQQLIGSSRPL